MSGWKEGVGRGGGRRGEECTSRTSLKPKCRRCMRHRPIIQTIGPTYVHSRQQLLQAAVAVAAG